MRCPAKSLLLLWVLLLVLGQLGCSRAHEREDAPGAAAAPSVPAAPAAVVAAVDLPAVVGRSIDEVRARLGPAEPLPANYYDPVGTRAGDSTLAFRPRGLVVVASYDARSRRVLDLLVLGPNEDVLMRRAGLLPDAPTYLLLPVFAPRPINQFVGLRVVPRG